MSDKKYGFAPSAPPSRKKQAGKIFWNVSGRPLCFTSLQLDLFILLLFLTIRQTQAKPAQYVQP